MFITCSEIKLGIDNRKNKGIHKFVKIELYIPEKQWFIKNGNGFILSMMENT